MIDNHDIDTLTRRFDDRYVTKNECDTKIDKTDAAIMRIDKTLTELSTKMRLFLWLGSAVGVAVIGIAIKYLFNVEV